MKTLNEQRTKSIQGQSYKILGIGTPIVDYLIDVTDDYIESLQGIRGGSFLVDNETLQKILNDQLKPFKVIAGGSAANTIKGLVQLGHQSALCGKIGNDETGKEFCKNLETNGIIPLLSISELPTAKAACLITPDYERTMRTFIGAGAEMNENDLTPELFHGVELVHIEGYLMNRQRVVEKAMKLAKEAGAKISFDVSSFETAEEYKNPIIKLIEKFVDILFSNEEEAFTLTGLPPEKACLFLKEICQIAIVKMGSVGGWAAEKDRKVFYNSFKVQAIDTTGAGDLFASGFLHGFLTNKPLEKTLDIASLIASNVVQRVGAEIPTNSWLEIKSQI